MLIKCEMIEGKIIVSFLVEGNIILEEPPTINLQSVVGYITIKAKYDVFF